MGILAHEQRHHVGDVLRLPECHSCRG
jgi:hypothetical protein